MFPSLFCHLEQKPDTEFASVMKEFLADPREEKVLLARRFFT